MSALSRRSLVTTAAALPALAVPAVAVARPDIRDQAAMVRRAEEIVDLLSTRYIREGWHESFDHDRAARFLQDVRQCDLSTEDVEFEEKIIAWAIDHEVSLDWLILGNPRSMICSLAGAEALPRACTRKSGSMSASVRYC
jgi:hypothetical protein